MVVLRVFSKEEREVRPESSEEVLEATTVVLMVVEAELDEYVSQRAEELKKQFFTEFSRHRS
jgi:hypothetical protein